MSRIYATLVPFPLAVVYHSTQTCCVCWREELYLASGPLCIVWKETICVLSWLTFFFFCCITTPFPASSPGETKGEYMILVRWSVLISSHQLWLLQQFKVTDPRTLCAVVGLSEMPYGTDWFMTVWILSQCGGFSTIPGIGDNKHAKICVFGVVQINLL